VVEARGPEVGAQPFAQALLVAEHDPEQNSAALAVQVSSDGAREPAAHAVAEAAESATVSEHAPAVAGQHDVDPVPSEPGPFVEAVARAARELRLRPHLENGAAGRRPPERKLELRRLVEDERTEASDANGHLDVETPSSGRGGDYNERLFGSTDLRAQHAVVESVEPRAAPPPAENREDTCGSGDDPTGRRGEYDGPGEGERGESREPDQICEGDPEAERCEQSVRW
jgi:hypothetical protein